MSAESNGTSWRITLPCTRAEAEAIDSASDLAIDAVLMTTEEVEDDVERWRLDAYVEHEPDAAMLATIHALAPSASDCVTASGTPGAGTTITARSITARVRRNSTHTSSPSLQLRCHSSRPAATSTRSISSVMGVEGQARSQPLHSAVAWPAG